MTSITTPVENKLEIRETTKTGTRTLLAEELPLQKLMDNIEHENKAECRLCQRYYIQELVTFLRVTLI